MASIRSHQAISGPRAASGLMVGPQLQLELRCSQMAAPLDALPYWAVPAVPRPVTAQEAVPEARERRLTSITLLFLPVFD